MSLDLKPYQHLGAAFLQNSRDSALLADEPGCVDGDAIVSINRAGLGKRMKLSVLYDGFTGRRHWDLAIPTRIRALVSGELRLHDVSGVYDRGVKPVVRLVLASGKALRLTADHEVATSADGGFSTAGSLWPGNVVVTNGAAACLECGATEGVSTYPYAKFRGFCRTCIYRKKRAKPTWGGGRFLDKDGYVWVSGQHAHPRAHGGAMREHILVIERAFGRRLGPEEIVHHKNGDKADNRLENLELTTNREHMSHHGRAGGYRNMDGGTAGRGGAIKFIPVEDRVVSVTPDGEAHVYDIVCADPHRNFIANGIVVHNCGKSAQALEAARLVAPHLPVLVVCPAVAKGFVEADGTVLGGWAEQVAMWRPDARPYVMSGRRFFRWPAPGEIGIMNWDVLPQPGEVAPPAWPLVIVLDEVHYAKSPDAARTKAARAMLRDVLATGGVAWGLSGTPMTREPLDLFEVLSTLGAERAAFLPPAGRNWTGAPSECAKSPMASFMWLLRGRAFGDKVRFGRPRPEARWALSRVVLRRRAAEVLPELPGRRWETLHLDVDRELVKAAENAASEVGDAGAIERALEALAKGGTITVSESASLAKGRRILAEAKGAALGPYLDDRLAQGDRPLSVLSAHRAPVLAVGARKGWGVIVGDDGGSENRARVVSEFQRGALDGIALTYRAGGVAITLTAGAHVVEVDLPWTPAELEQGERRFDRLGQTRSVLVTRVLAIGSKLDEIVLRVLERRRKEHAAILGDDRPARVAATVAAPTPAGQARLFT